MTDHAVIDELCRHQREAVGTPWFGLYARVPRCPECEREAYEAWERDVRARFESALTAIANGWGWTWEQPGVYVRPDLQPSALIKCYDDGTVAVTLDGGFG